MQCLKCKKTNSEDANFCSRCGVSLNNKTKCPICLEIKENKILICGHTGCIDCLSKSYEFKKKCPICREKIYKCEKCESFRVIKTTEKTECLDCKHITKTIRKEQKKILCIDCKSNRVLYNTDNRWSCLDCFCNFKITNNVASLDSLISTTTKICSLCCSNDIEYNDTKHKCLNCEQDNVKLKHITLEEYSRLRIKTKEEVNKIKDKMYNCVECNSSNICKMVNLSDPLEELYFCKTCNKSGIKIKAITI